MRRGVFFLLIGAAGVLNAAVLLWLSWDQVTAVVDEAVWARRQRGFRLRRFVDDDGSVHRYSVFVPPAESFRPGLPLIVYLNGFGENGDDGHSPLLNGLATALWESQRDFPCVVVWPQCPQGKSWVRPGPHTERVFRIIDVIQQQYHTDPDRVIVTGLSSGGAGAWHFAGRFPDRFAAVVPISSGADDQENLYRIAESGLPVWSFHVAEDGEGVVAGCRAAQQILYQAGSSPWVTELSAGERVRQSSLHDAWSYAFRNSGLFAWMARQNRRLRQGRVGDRMPLTQWPLKTAGAPDGESEGPGAETSASAHEQSREDGGVIRLLCRGDGRCEQDAGPTWADGGEVHVQFSFSRGVRRCGLGWAWEDSGAIQHGLFFEIPCDFRVIQDGGGLFVAPERRADIVSDPVAEHVVVPEQWNEVRVCFREESGEGAHEQQRDGRKAVSAELNGWPLLGGVTRQVMAPDARLVFFVEGREGASVTWRFLRTRAGSTGPLPEGASRERIRPDVANAESHESSGPSSEPEEAERKEMERLTTDRVRAAWEELVRHFDTVRVMWEEDDTGVSRWNRFRGGLACDRPLSVSADSLMLSGDRAVLSGPWMYPRTRVSRRTGLTGGNLLSEFEVFRKNGFRPHAAQFSGSFRYRSIRNGMVREDVVIPDAGTDGRGIRYSAGEAAVFRSGQVEEACTGALLLALRPGQPCGGGIRPDRCQVAGRGVWIGGVRAAVLEERWEQGGTAWRRLHAVDPDRHCRVLRSVTFADEQFRQQTDIRYQDTSDGFGRPVRWSVVARKPAASTVTQDLFPGSERLFDFACGRVVSWSRPDAGEVRLTDGGFPEGTRFFDQPTGQWYRQGAGDRRDVLPDDVILALASGTALPDSDRSHRRELLLAGIGLVGLWLLWRRREKRVVRA